MTDFWMERLTYWDMGLAAMVESLTGRDCVLKNGGDCYFFEADYRDNRDPDYLMALWEAIEGRAGDRLVEIRDDPDRNALFVKVRFGEAPRLVMGRHGKCKAGDSVVVGRDNADELYSLVGNGVLEVHDGGPAVYRFLNACGCVYADAWEGDTITYVRPGHYKIDRWQQ